VWEPGRMLCSVCRQIKEREPWMTQCIEQILASARMQGWQVYCLDSRQAGAMSITLHWEWADIIHRMSIKVSSLDRDPPTLARSEYGQFIITPASSQAMIKHIIALLGVPQRHRLSEDTSEGMTTRRHA
jgi:hypothetical protein